MIEITEAAAKLIRQSMSSEGMTDGGLRVGVKAGGCNGMSYVFRWESSPKPDDEIFETQEGTPIFVDKKSYIYLVGTELDFSDGLNGKGFVFENPNAKKACGCGTSFSV